MVGDRMRRHLNPNGYLDTGDLSLESIRLYCMRRQGFQVVLIYDNSHKQENRYLISGQLGDQRINGQTDLSRSVTKG